MSIDPQEYEQPQFFVKEEMRTDEPYYDSLQALLTRFDQYAPATGVLLPFTSLAYTDIERFDGRSMAEALPQRKWEQFYHDLQRSVHDGGLSSGTLPSLREVKQIATAGSDDTIVPIVFANISYDAPMSQFVEHVFDAMKGQQAVPLPDVLEDVMQTKRAVCSAVLLPDRFDLFTLLPPVHRGTQVKFLVDERFCYSNEPSLPSFFEIDFGDERGFRTVSFGQVVGVDYGEAGSRVIRIRAHYAGQVLESACMLSLIAKPIIPLPDVTWALTASIAYNGVCGMGTAYVLYGYDQSGKKHSSLIRPLMIADGFPGHRYDEIYDSLNTLSLLTSVLEGGYDAVLLTYENGRDYVQRNAFVAIACVERMKRERSSNEQLVVGGGSMGGIITRYALRYMELNGMQHDARLFFTLDSPHQGAQIPPSDQFQIRELADLFGDTTAIANKELLGSIAAQQFLYSNAIVKSDLHSQLYSELRQMGYPQQCKKVGIANGSGNGVPLFDPYVQTLYWSALAVVAAGYDKMLPAKSPDIIEISNIRNFTHYRTYAVRNYRNYDNAPGGLRSTNGELAEAIRLSSFSPYVESNYNDSCFIPTISALDIPITATTDQYTPVPTKEAATPFDTYFVSTSNSYHVEITGEIRIFLLKQLGITAVLTPSLTSTVYTQGMIDYPRVYDVFANGQIHEYGWNSQRWLDRNISIEASGALAFLDQEIGAEILEGGSAPAVFYISSSDNHVRELHYISSSASWRGYDLTAITNSIVAAGRTVSAVTLSNGYMPRVYYIGSDAHIHELGINGNSWSEGDVTARANGPDALLAQNISAIVIANGTSLAIYYMTADHFIHELLLNRQQGTWSGTNITAVTNVNAYAGGSSVSAIPFKNGNLSRIYYVGHDAHIHELGWNGSAWFEGDLTVLVHGLDAVLEQDVSAQIIDNGNGISVYYIATDRHVHQLYYGGSWRDFDLTATTNATVTAMGKTISASAVSHGNLPRVYYFGDDAHVHELAWSGSVWSESDITARVGVTPAIDEGLALQPGGDVLVK